MTTDTIMDMSKDLFDNGWKYDLYTNTWRKNSMCFKNIREAHAKMIEEFIIEDNKKWVQNG